MDSRLLDGNIIDSEFLSRNSSSHLFSPQTRDVCLRRVEFNARAILSISVSNFRHDVTQAMDQAHVV